jgi:hypothetical protein
MAMVFTNAKVDGDPIIFANGICLEDEFDEVRFQNRTPQSQVSREPSVPPQPRTQQDWRRAHPAHIQIQPQ